MANQNSFQESAKSSGKILLVFPQASESNVEPPLGISFIASCLRRASREVDLLDQTVDPEKRLNWNQYFVVGMSLLCVNFKNGTKLAKQIRQENKNIFIVAGGPFADTCPKEVLETGVFDVVVHGEGERVFVELVEALKNGQDFSDIKGLSFFRNGKIIRTENSPLIGDLDTLPFPAYDLLAMNKYRKSSIIASRGCPFSCIFCTRGPTESKTVRRISPERLIEWVTLLVEGFGHKYIRFTDSTFTLDQEWAERVCDLIMECGLRFNWECQTRIDCLNSALLGKMKKAGCQQLEVGIETGNDKILTLLRKGFSKADVRMAAQLFKDVAAPRLSASFIIGHPWDTIKTIRETFELAEELRKKLDANYELFLLIPLPGTELWNNAEKYGLKITKNWEDFYKKSFWNNPCRLVANFDTKYLSHEELTELYHLLESFHLFFVKGDFKQAQRMARQLISKGFLTFNLLAIAIFPHIVLKYLSILYQKMKHRNRV